MFQTTLAATNAWAYVIFALYMAMIVVVAIVTRRKSSTINDFMFANKGVGGWLSAFAYGATYFSAVVFVGYAGKFGWNFGLAAVWIGIGNAIFGTWLAWIVLAKRTKRITNALGARTMPDFFEKRYESKTIKLFASVLIFIFLLPYSSSVYQGLGYIFASVLGIKPIWCILILAVLTALYLFMGGYFATSITDFIQGIIMIVGVVAILGVLIGSPTFDANGGFAALQNMGFGIIPSAATPEGGTFLNNELFNVIILVLLTSFGIWGLPQSVHKFYAIKDNNAIKKGTIISTAFSIVVGGGAYLTGALITRFISPETFTGELGSNFDKLIPTMIQQNLPSALLGLIIVLLFSASMSTLAALSLSSASTVSVDMYKGYIKRNASEKNVNIVMRVLCLVFVAISAVLAIIEIDAIVTMMSLSWGVLAGCFIGPYVLGLYSKKINKVGAYASMIGSLLLTLAMIIGLGIWQTPDGATVAQVLKKGISYSPFMGVCAMALSFVTTGVFSLIFKKKNVSSELLSVVFPSKQAAAALAADGETEVASDVADGENTAVENASETVATENNAVESADVSSAVAATANESGDGTNNNISDTL